MEAEDINEVVRELASTVDGPASMTIAEYTRNLHAEAIYGFSVGVIFVAASLIVGWCVRKRYLELRAEEEGGAYVDRPVERTVFCGGAAVGVFLIGIATIGCNVGDLVAPKASAIHVLIRDVKE